MRFNLRLKGRSADGVKCQADVSVYAGSQKELLEQADVIDGQTRSGRELIEREADAGADADERVAGTERVRCARPRDRVRRWFFMARRLGHWDRLRTRRRGWSFVEGRLPHAGRQDTRVRGVDLIERVNVAFGSYFLFENPIGRLNVGCHRDSIPPSR